MPEKKEEVGDASYVFGIISIVLAFFTPLAGLIFGVIGLVVGKKDKTSVGKKGAKLSKIGIVISIIVLIITIVVAILASKGVISNISNFPIQ
jgi:hypothetical protein